MPTRTTADLGAPTWIDLTTSDVAARPRFYPELFGWTAEEPSEEFGGYFMFLPDGQPVAGCMPRMDEAHARRLVGLPRHRRRREDAGSGGGGGRHAWSCRRCRSATRARWRASSTPAGAGDRRLAAEGLLRLPRLRRDRGAELVGAA